MNHLPLVFLMRLRTSVRPSNFPLDSECRLKRQTNLTSLWWLSVDLSDAYQIVLLKDGCCHGYLSYDLKFFCDEI